MERIKNILQRLQEVYYGKHQKSAIDVDLMMDYTRVMYADLIEWRKQFQDPPTTETAEKNTGVITSGVENTDAQVSTPTAPVDEPAEDVSQADQVPPAESGPADMGQEQDGIQAPAEINTVETGATEAKDQQHQATRVERDEPPAREPVTMTGEPVIKLYPEKEKVEALKTGTTGISFEPPALHEVKTELKENVLAEETPLVNQPVEEISSPAPLEIPLPDVETPAAAGPATIHPLNLFHAAKAANKDIRSAIGINDKYLFLNELFNNHKSNYEETLDKLNHFSTMEQAEDWIRTKVAPAQKWDRDDATVQGFYAMLSKHFSVR